jgi:recombination protein RecR
VILTRLCFAVIFLLMLPKSLKKLIEEFSKLPGIGPKSAQRLAMHLLKTPHSKIEPLGNAVLGLKEGVMFCQKCWNLADDDPCGICSNKGRDQAKICVVEEVLDAAAIEKTGEFDGVYHVLHGVLSPIDGVGPEELKIASLVGRVRIATEEGSPVKELILATNPSLEGEATALYIQKQLNGFEGKITRIARGLPTGGDIEYSDDLTLSRAMNGRSDF